MYKSYILTADYLNACKKCLTEIGHDENLDFPHSLPICILDAVFSIGIRYKEACKAWKKYADYYKLSFGQMGDFFNNVIDENEHTISDFLNNVNSFQNIECFRNAVGISTHRTSPTNGILKIEAVVQIAEIMRKHNIDTVSDLKNYTDKCNLNKQILAVHGQGSGIMLRYLYMLAGTADECKPDRWILRFVQKYFPDITIENIEKLFKQTVETLRPEYPDLTMRMLDNAVWKYMTK